MRIVLAPMEGLVDDLMRDAISRIGGIDWCVTEFVRVTSALLPAKTYHRLAPELLNQSRTPAGVPVRVQLLGNDPACLAENAARAAELGAVGIDLNFGCPAPTVNRHRGGAILLKEPELLHAIMQAVRAAVPAHLPVTAKMRLGYEDTSLALDCARALATGGAEELVVHARTKVDGYRPPAYWEWIPRIVEVVSVPVIANGEIWSLDDLIRCRQISGCEDVMLGRGLIARPDLALQARAWAQGQTVNPMPWADIQQELARFFAAVQNKNQPKHAPGRVKQWLGLLLKSYPEASMLFHQIRTERDSDVISAILAKPCELTNPPS